MTKDEHTEIPDAPRLFVDAALAPNATVTLHPEQTHYLLRVMRQPPGGEVLLFNGRDGLWRARIGDGDRRRASLTLEAQIKPQPPATGPWLAFGIPKRPAMETVLQKATELGTSRFLPISSQRAMRDRLNVDRLARIAAEAAEQCERLDVPVVETSQTLAYLLSTWPTDRILFWCDETGEGEPLADAADALLGDSEDGEAEAPPPWALMIGPEGGFAPDELDGLSELPFVRRVTLGPRILRADTAAIAALAIAQAMIGDGDLQTRWTG